jgi:hypothetical protein
MYELLGISFAVIALDVTLIIIKYMNLYYLQVCLKVMVYSIKLKLEFAVLGELDCSLRSRGVKQGVRVQRLEFIGQPVDLGQFTGGTVTTTLPSVGEEEDRDGDDADVGLMGVRWEGVETEMCSPQNVSNRI